MTSQNTTQKHGPINAYTISMPHIKPSMVSEITEIEIKGPWKTKSDAELSVLFALPIQTVQSLFNYNKDELSLLSQDIRGMRSYSVCNVRKGKVGGAEFHRVRTELLLATRGMVKLTCRDLYGNETDFIVDQKKGYLMPPFIMHTYEAVSDADLLVVCNTLFDPKDPQTHDTYEPQVFDFIAASIKEKRM